MPQCAEITLSYGFREDEIDVFYGTIKGDASESPAMQIVVTALQPIVVSDGAHRILYDLKNRTLDGQGRSQV